MSDEIRLENLTGAASGDAAHMLGKLLYFSLSNLLVDRQALGDLCKSMGIYYAGGKRVSVIDAFRSATGDIRDRVISKASGETKIYLVYCRDNRRTSPGVFSRELVKETLNRETNRYEKLANISLDRNSGYFGYDNLAFDSEVDAGKYCRAAQELFELYQTCANRKQVETVCMNFLQSLDATKLSVNGHLYFVPQYRMERVDIFEDFIAAVAKLNQIDNPLIANSIYVIDDAKQRDKMTEEFYAAVKKEIAEYQERADYLIKSGCCSPAILDRWVLKIGSLEDKKRHYENILRRELDGLDDEFTALKGYSQELAIRARGIRARKAA